MHQSMLERAFSFPTLPFGVRHLLSLTLLPLRSQCQGLLCNFVRGTFEDKKKKGDLSFWKGAVDAVGKLSPRPVLLLHGSADDVVPAWHSEMIYFNAHGPRTLWIAPGGHHNQLYDSHREGVQRRVEEVVRVAVARKNEAEVA